MKLSFSSPDLKNKLKLRKYINVKHGVINIYPRLATLMAPKVDRFNKTVCLGVCVAILIVLVLSWDYWIRQDEPRTDLSIPKAAEKKPGMIYILNS